MTMEVADFARYPFLKDAAEYVKDQGISAEDLLQSEAYRPARTRGKQRIIQALDQGEVKSGPAASDADLLDEILSYPVARIMVSCISDKFLTRRYALAEAMALEWRLESEEEDMIEEIAYQLGVDASWQDNDVRMYFSNYLRFSSRIRSKEWKLVNTEVKGGYVVIPKMKFARILRQALQDRIEEELPLPVPDWIVQLLDADLKEIKDIVAIRKEKYKADDFGKVSIENFPPCMQNLIGMTQAGENLPHTGRFSLTAFLHNIGLSQDEILLLFSLSPDFDMSKTKYQVDHITGETSGTEYTPPECSTMKSYGICFNPDSLCTNPRAKISHPLSYYRIKNRPRRPEPAKKSSEDKEGAT